MKRGVNIPSKTSRKGWRYPLKDSKLGALSGVLISKTAHSKDTARFFPQVDAQIVKNGLDSCTPLKTHKTQQNWTPANIQNKLDSLTTLSCKISLTVAQPFNHTKRSSIQMGMGWSAIYSLVMSQVQDCLTSHTCQRWREPDSRHWRQLDVSCRQTACSSLPGPATSTVS